MSGRNETLEEPMSLGMRILVIASSVIIVLALIAWAVAAFWARPGRLDESECRELVRRAWQASAEEKAVGVRTFEYRLGEYRHRVPAKSPPPFEFARLADRLVSLFPQREPDEAFFRQVRLSHRGRLRVAGRACERVRIAPSEYEGQSIELWVDPESGYPLGWRKLDPRGRLVRGYRYLRAELRSREGEPPSGEEVPKNPTGLTELLEGDLIPPERVTEMAKRGEIAFPRWLPLGFELSGARALTALSRFQELRELVRGEGAGLRRGAGPMQGVFREGGHRFQMIFSDGLNTISIVQFVSRQWPGEGMVNPVRAEEVINHKAKEIDRVFHVSMAGRMAPGAVVLLFGEVAPEVLQDVAESLEMPRPESVGPGLRPPGLGPEGPRAPGREFRGPFGPPIDRPRDGGLPPEPPSDPE